MNPTTKYHTTLATYFVTQPHFFDGEAQKKPHIRKCMELPFQQTKAELWDEVTETLCDLMFLQAKCSANKVFDLIFDYDQVEQEFKTSANDFSTLAEFKLFIIKTSHILNIHPDLILQIALNQPDNTNVYLSAKNTLKGKGSNYPWFDWLNKPKLIFESSQSFVGHTSCINTCNLSSDGKYLVTGDGLIGGETKDYKIMVWDLTNGSNIVVFRGHSDEIVGCSISPDNKTVISSSKDKVTLLWDLTSGNIISSEKEENGIITCIDWEPKGSRIAIMYSNGDIVFRDSINFHEKEPIKIHFWTDMGSGSNRILKWSPEGKMIASADKFNLKIWDPDTKEILSSYENKDCSWGDFFTCVAWSHDSTKIAVSLLNGELYLFDVLSGKLQKVLKQESAGILSCEWSEDGKHVATGDQDGIFSIWNVVTGEKILQKKAHDNMIMNCLWMNTSSELITTGRTIKLWELKNFTTSFQRHNQKITCCSWSPDGNRLVSSSHDHTIKISDHENSSNISAVLNGHTEEVYCSTWSPDGSKIISGSRDKSIIIWDADRHKILKRLSGHHSFVSACAFSPDGQYLLTGSWDYSSIIWDMTNYEEVTALFQHDEEITCCAWSADNSKFITGSFDKKLIVYNAMNFSSLAILSGHNSYVLCCSWSPCGNYLVSGDASGFIKIWDITKMVEIKTIEAHTDRINCCTFIPETSYFLTGADDCTIGLWNINQDNIICRDAIDGQCNCISVSANKYIIAGDANGHLYTLKLNDINSL